MITPFSTSLDYRSPVSLRPHKKIIGSLHSSSEKNQTGRRGIFLYFFVGTYLEILWPQASVPVNSVSLSYTDPELLLLLASPSADQQNKLTTIT